MTGSIIGWLDHSYEQQRRMREIIDLFSETDSRDELGIATIRDAFSDLLFPGLSTIQTRARYFLFVPWIYLGLERKRVTSARIPNRAREAQTQLIYALINADQAQGVIGIDAKENLKRLPDTIYWHGLSTFDIATRPGDLTDYQSSLDRFYRRQRSQPSDGLDGEPAPLHNWRPTIPEAPSDLFETTSFDLTNEEARFLRERVVLTHQGSLLAHLLKRGEPIEAESPWAATNANDLGPELGRRLDYARFFSELILGAALLYNLMLAEEATKRELQSGGEYRVDGFRSRLSDWAGLITGRHHELASVDRRDFWALIESTDARIDRSRVFVDAWLDLALETHGDLADNAVARALVSDREHRLKRGNARLHNPRHLELWGGSSGANQLLYRWGTATTMVNDISAGLNR